MIDVEIEDPAWTAVLGDAEELARIAGAATLELVLGAAVSDAEGPRALLVADASVEARDGVTVLLTDNASVRDLNARFRRQDKPTNVLSFPAPANPEHHLGDVALAYGVCAGEAHEQGKPLAHHLQHLVAHGVLHLLGYDHMNDAEADEMEGLERVVLAGLGIPDPYLAGEGDHERPRP
ncbi:rRNA maturation RNase YbeY [Phenylobacterium sp.]|uniref:rRNA maturation RNase YbeY n=1 Tax=Phenylobacterium sp. TaxID=1871053 RepID=UPI002F3EE1FC